MNYPIDPELIEKARARLANTFGCLPTRSGICAEHGGTMHGVSCDVPTDALRDVLGIVANDLRAEGAATALDLVRADIRAAALIRSYDPPRSMWTNQEVFDQAGIYTTEWLNDLLAYDSEEKQS